MNKKRVLILLLVIVIVLSGVLLCFLSKDKNEPTVIPYDPVENVVNDGESRVDSEGNIDTPLLVEGDSKETAAGINGVLSGTNTNAFINDSISDGATGSGSQISNGEDELTNKNNGNNIGDNGSGDSNEPVENEKTDESGKPDINDTLGVNELPYDKLN